MGDACNTNDPGFEGASGNEVKEKFVPVWEQLQEELEELKGKFQDLCDAFKCPVCLDFLHQDTILCINGHSVCVKCNGENEICPTCREKYSNVKQNSMVRQVLDTLSRTCKYENCSDLVKPADDHEIYCYHRPTGCEIADCLWEGPVKELSNHLRDTHNKTIFPEKNEFLAHGPFDPNKECGFTSLFSAYGHYLWQIWKNDPATGLLKYTYIPVFNGKPSCDILVKRCFKSRKMEYVITMRISMDQSVDHTTENCMTILTSELKSIWHQSSKTLPFSLFITKATD